MFLDKAHKNLKDIEYFISKKNNNKVSIFNSFFKTNNNNIKLTQRYEDNKNKIIFTLGKLFKK